MTLARPRIKIRPGYEVYKCPEPGCTLCIAAPAGTIPTHGCPYQGGTTHISPGVQLMHMLDQTWQEADRTYDDLMELKASREDGKHDEVEFTRGRLAGLCWALQGFYGAECGVRWAAEQIVARAALRAEGKMAPIPPSLLVPPPETRTPQVSQANVRASHNYGLSDSDVAKIKNSSFPPELLAGIYKRTAAQIEAIQKS